MMELYYYIPSNEIENAIECGMKLSRWFDKEVEFKGDVKKCLSTLLNPKDDIEKFRSNELACIKLELNPGYCFVADKYLYEVGINSPEIMKLYNDSIMPLSKYIFGSYRMPECLITSTVLAGQVSRMDKRRDSPVLFESSEQLYINNIIQEEKDEHTDFDDAALYYIYSKLTQIGRVKKVEDVDEGLVIFIDNEKGKTISIKKPDISKY